MTDRELLELAAKAAGFDVSHFDRDKRAMVVFAIDGDENPDQEYWNPLTDDGDALRLAVKFGLTLVVESDIVFCRNQRSDKAFREQSNDPYAATRRAIVRAAAEIGETTK